MNNYTLTARNGMPNSIEINIPNLIKIQLRDVFGLACRAFRDVSICANETGEVIYSFYADDDFYEQTDSFGYVINELNALYAENERARKAVYRNDL